MRRTFLALALGALAALALIPALPVQAHAPHDVISDVAVSPDFPDDQTVMVIARGRLMRSGDGGASWTLVANGLDNGSTLTEVEIAPSDPSVVYAAAERVDGVYRSYDGGRSWEQTTDGIDTPDISVLVASPHSATTVFAASGETGLVRSTDAGETWDLEETSSPVTALAFAADDEAGVFRGSASGVVEESVDGGSTWRTLATADEAITAIAEIDQGRLVVATADGELLRLDDGADDFERLSFDEPVVSVDTDGSDVWAVAAEVGPFLSTDGGDTWDERTDGVTSNAQSDTPPTDVADFTRLAVADDGTLFLGGWDGLFRSDDRGQSWYEIETLEGVIVGLALSPEFSSDETIAVSTYVNGVRVSDDGGRSWSEPGNDLHLTPDGYSTRLFNLAFSPTFAEDRTLFSTTTDAFLRSEDLGTTWTRVDLAEVEPGSDKTRVDILAISPAYQTDTSLFLGTKEGGILRSADGGVTFTVIGQLPGSVNSLVVSPAFERDRTMFASIRPMTEAGAGDPAAGVYKSTDGGSTWDQTDFSGGGPMAISPAFDDDATVFASHRRAIHVSRDGGATWPRVSLPDWGRGPLEALAVSPEFADDGMVLASVRGIGLYRSTDAGDSFDQVVEDPIERNYPVADFDKPTAVPIQFSPAYAEDRTIFAFGGSDLLRSTDGADSWTSVNRPASPATAPWDSGTAAGSTSDDDSSSSTVLFIAAVAAIAAIAAIGAGVGWALARRRTPTPPADPPEDG